MMQYKFLAFISYSRRDEVFARNLHRDLEEYRLPTSLPCDRSILHEKKLLRPIFLDHTHLGVRSAKFWEEIETQITQSRYFLLVCSPASAQSENVNREVQHFLSTRPDAINFVIPIWLDGQISVEDGPERCLPPSLLLHRELFVNRNLPNARSSSNLELLLRTISWILAVDYETLYERHRRRHTQQVTAASVISVVVVALLTGLGFYAAAQKRQATKAINEKTLQTIRADTEALAASRNDYLGLIRLSAQSLEQNNLEAARKALERCPKEHRNWEWGYLQGQIDTSVAQYECSQGAAPLAASPDGTQLAVCSKAGRLRTYRLSDQKKLLDLQATDGDLRAAAWSNDGKLIATGTTNEEISVWRADTGERVSTYLRMGCNDCAIGDILFLPGDSHLIFSSRAGGLERLEVQSGKKQGLMLIASVPLRFVYSRDLNLVVALADTRDQMMAFDAETCERRWYVGAEIEQRFTDIDLSRDGRRLLVGTRQDGVWLCNAATGAKITKISTGDTEVIYTRWSKDGDIYIVLADGTTEVHQFFDRVDKIKFYKRFVISPTRISTFAPIDYEYLLAGMANGEVSLVSPHSGKEAERFRGHVNAITGARQIQRAQNDRGTGFLATWSWDGTARLWSMERKLTRTKKENRDPLADMNRGVLATVVTPSPDGKRSVLRSQDMVNTAVLLGERSYAQMAVLKHSKWVGTVVFSRDSKYILTGSQDATAKTWQAADGKLIRELVGHQGPVTSAEFSPSGTTVATASMDGTVRLWDYNTGAMLQQFNVSTTGVAAVTFDNKGERLAIGDVAGNITILRIADGKRIAELFGHEKAVQHLEFSQDDSKLLSGSKDTTARLWEVNSGKLLRTFQAGGKLAGASLNPDATRALTYTDGAVLMIWDIETGSLILPIQLAINQGIDATFSRDGKKIIATGELAEVFTLIGVDP